ncbi:MAG TPA: hypothetical protein VEI97_20570 [bacterium]|nr:hypothetical protein [bacterium]
MRAPSLPIALFALALGLGQVTISSSRSTVATNLLFSPDNTYDIGATNTNRPRNVYIASSLIAGSDIQVAQASQLMFGGRTRLHSAADNTLVMWGASQSDFTRLQFGGTTSAYNALTPVRASNVPQGFILGLADGTTQTFANLGAATNGTMIYCSDCTFANPCAGAGTGAIAKRLNGAWRCD